MKRSCIVLAFLLMLGPACSPSGAKDSENGVGTGGSASAATLPASAGGSGGRAADGPTILYQLSEHIVRRGGLGSRCYSFTFLRCLDAGIIRPDGSGNIVLELKDNPTSKARSRKSDRYFYISTPNPSVKKLHGFEMPDWEAPGQTLWSAAFAGGEPVAVARDSGGRFPGGLAVSPGNRYLVYPMAARTKRRPRPNEPVVFGKFDPFSTDSSLVIVDLASGRKTTVLASAYNRQLFASFADFSPNGNAFYTIARAGSGFRFVRISLGDGKVEDFATAFPRFDRGSVHWDKLFPRANDFAWASFTISPDETRLIATKDAYGKGSISSCSCDAYHTLWVFALSGGATRVYRKRRGYVSDAEWRGDSSSFALALVGHGGCYPEYLDSTIKTFDRDGRPLTTLVSEPKSKITTIGWSPTGRLIAYDVYGTDFIGRLKTVNTSTKRVRELVNTLDLGHGVSRTHPVTLLFSAWVVPAR